MSTHSISQLSVHPCKQSTKRNSVAKAVSCKQKKRRDYTFRRQFNGKPSSIPGCPAGCCLYLPVKSSGTLKLRADLHLITPYGHTRFRTIAIAGCREVHVEGKGSVRSAAAVLSQGQRGGHAEAGRPQQGPGQAERGLPGAVPARAVGRVCGPAGVHRTHTRSSLLCTHLCA